MEKGHLIDALRVTSQSAKVLFVREFCVLIGYSYRLLKLLYPEMESRYTICCVCSHGLPFAAGRIPCECTFLSSASRSERACICLKVPKLCPFVLLIRVNWSEEKYGALVRWYRWRITEVLVEKPSPLTLFVPLIC